MIMSVKYVTINFMLFIRAIIKSICPPNDILLLSMHSLKKMETVTIQTATNGTGCIYKPTGSNSQPAKLLTSQGSRGQRDSWKTRTRWKPISLSILCILDISDMWRPPSHNLSAFATLISGCDIFQGIWNLVNSVHTSDRNLR